MHRRLALMILLGCHQAATSVAAPAAPATNGHGEGARARAILDAQVASIVANDAALVGSFTPDAVVLVPDARLAKGETTGLREAITRLEPGARLKGLTVGTFSGGGDDGALWWSAELAVTRADGKTTTIRATELATKDAGWKVVAGAFAELGKPGNTDDAGDLDEASSTPAGTLAPLLGKPAALSAALATAAVVFGTDKGEAAWDGAAAKKLLAGWSHLDLSVPRRVRERSGAGWSFAMTYVDWKQPKKKYLARMAGLVIADGSRHVVAVQYTAP
jgi:ketosteroid isomerase-like protein